MSTEENKAIVRRYVEGFWNWDETLIDELAGPHASPGGGTPEDIKVFQRDAHRLFPDMTCTIEELIAEGDQVVMRATYRGTHQGEIAGPYGPVPPTGKPLTLIGVSIYRVQDGKIIEDRAIGNDLELWQQLGVIPTPGQSSS